MKVSEVGQRGTILNHLLLQWITTESVLSPIIILLLTKFIFGFYGARDDHFHVMLIPGLQISSSPSEREHRRQR